MLPTRHTLQPSGQHVGVLDVQVQVFCSRMNPEKCVARHVVRLGSKSLTPSTTLSTMISLLRWWGRRGFPDRASTVTTRLIKS